MGSQRFLQCWCRTACLLVEAAWLEAFIHLLLMLILFMWKQTLACPGEGGGGEVCLIQCKCWDLLEGWISVTVWTYTLDWHNGSTDLLVAPDSPRVWLVLILCTHRVEWTESACCHCYRNMDVLCRYTVTCLSDVAMCSSTATVHTANGLERMLFCLSLPP